MFILTGRSTALSRDLGVAFGNGVAHVNAIETVEKPERSSFVQQRVQPEVK